MKKVLLSIVVLLVVLVAAFFCVGFIYPSVEFSTTVEINKPRDVTWQVMRERRDWIYGFKSYEQLNGNPDQPGSRARITVERGGRETVLDAELLDVKPPECAVTQFTNDTLIHHAAVQLTESGGKTTVVSTEKLEGTNAFWRSIFAIFRSQIVDTSQKNFAGLKQAVESTK